MFNNPFCRCVGRSCYRMICSECGASLGAHVRDRELAERIAAGRTDHNCGPEPYEYGGYRRLGPLVAYH